MLLAEEPLDVLCDRLRALPPRDVQAVMARLTPPEQARLKTALRAPAVVEQITAYAPDIAARIAAPENDGAMTQAGREALARCVSRAGLVPAQPAPVSLVERLAGWLRS